MIARATWKGEIIAETKKWEEVENNIYFPPTAINKDLLKETKKETTCPWKGKASYYNITIQNQTIQNAAWTYKEPEDEAKHIKNHIAFWKDINVTTKEQ